MSTRFGVVVLAVAGLLGAGVGSGSPAADAVAGSGAAGAADAPEVAVPPGSPVADAAREGDRDAVRRLIEGGADVSAPQADGMTALHWAARNGDVVLAEMLIHAGADLGAGTRNGSYAPLHVAASEGEGAVVEVLLEAGAGPAPVTTTTGVTPLHLAARAGSVRAIRALLARGVDVDLREETWDQTPLIFAADFGRVEAVRALLEAGAAPSLHERVVHVPSLAAVDSAARHARDRALETFRESSPDPDRWRASPSQVQAAMDAAREIQLDPPEELLQRVDELVRASGGDQDLGDRPPNGYEELVGHQGGLTALLHGVREGHCDVVVALLD
ncbi:MAG: hypothetical protein GWO00_10640, partial [Gemmatimonadetes bacterium]|nr:hypothetical protein [Gemmatimonadota bacterium]NIP78346.1 hypothetical protein [Gemmatimonadota bacterium]NIR78810.1 hypothetical protein [Gemmatimonadota bacterium]NIU32240.1 hypothetical protein [Gemmatimonadota bacterium]NIU36781.1 hypothetical protein [Gemmatimonadota bacterium]